MAKFDHDHTFVVPYVNLVPLRSDGDAPCAFKSGTRVPDLNRIILRPADDQGKTRVDYGKRDVGVSLHRLYTTFTEVVPYFDS